MKMKSHALGLTVLIVLFGGILLTSALNLWKTESEKVPVALSQGEATGEYNPDDIRGSYSFGEISELFGIPLENLSSAFMLPPDVEPSTFQNKELEEMYGEIDGEAEIGNGSVKLFVALYTGLPFEIDEDIYLPRQAVIILKEQGNLTAEEIEYLEAHTFELSPGQITDVDPDIDSVVDHEEDEKQIQGNTTFQDLLDWGVVEETIEEIIGGEMPNKLMTIKDYSIEKEIGFDDIKVMLQSEVDNASQ